MANAVLIYGRSGVGKTASLRNVKGKWFVINVNNKPLPFKTTESIKTYACDDYLKIKNAISKAVENGYKSIVIDDAGYLMTSKFMTGHRQSKGNNGFELYNEIADNYYNLVKFISDDIQGDVVVYVVMHEDKNEVGESKPKTIGKLLDDKVCVEGMFTIALHAMKLDGKYLFATNSDGLDVAKSPIGMFENDTIENDLQLVNDKILDYYKS